MPGCRFSGWTNPAAGAIMPQVNKPKEMTMRAKPWYENDDFWKTTQPVLFAPDRMAAASGHADSIAARLKLKPGGRVLDLCCGPGRHSLELARRGFAVTGVDRTVSFLRQARRQARAEGLKIEFIRQDMRRFVRPQAFDAAISMFTSFGYFANPADDARVAAHVCRSLVRGGKFLIDTQGKESLARRFEPSGWYEKEGYTVLEDRKVMPDWSGMENHWILFKGGRRWDFRFKLRLYSATELKRLLRDAGFRRVDVFGSLEGAPYDHTAQRLVAVAQK
jgi:SAM-dependent methyltransferase